MAGKFIITVLALAVAVSAQKVNETAAATAAVPFSHFPVDADPNDFSCDPAGHIFLLLPHFTDCGKFFMCTHGQEVEFDCPSVTIFDFFQQTCGWPELSRCVLRTLVDEGSGDEVNDDMLGRFMEPVEQQGFDSIVSVRPMAPLLSQFNGIINCNRADQAAKQVPYRGDCQRYWKCVNGLPQVAYCSDGLFFNAATQQCDFEANSKCDPSLPEDELESEFIVYK